MKGVVFTEFLEMVGAKFGEDMVDDIIDDSNLEHGGAYTSVGTYPHQEIVVLLGALAKRSQIDSDVLMRNFGEFLFGRFHALYPNFFQDGDSSFSFMGRVESNIHVEVKKLYPEAELPSFEFERVDDDHIAMTYRSARPFSALAHGLIAGCGLHFGETLAIEREADFVDGVRFAIHRVP